MKEFTFDIELYDSRIHVLNNVSDEEFEFYMFAQFRQRPDRTTGQGACWTIPDTNGKQHYVLDFTKKLSRTPASVNIIVHESLHAAFEIMKHLSIPYVYNVSDEVFCYLCGYIVEKTMEGI
jgi:hypothetical protein